MNLTKTLLGIILLCASVWGISQFSKTNHSVSKTNNNIRESWYTSNKSEPIKETVKLDPIPPFEPRPSSSLQEVPPPVRKPKTESSSTIINVSRRDFVTGDEMTYIVPSYMKRMTLNIINSSGKVVQTYSLPHWAIDIKPNQRIQLKVIR